MMQNQKTNSRFFPYNMSFTINKSATRLNNMQYSMYRIVMFLLMAVNFIIVQLYSHQKDIYYFTAWGLLFSLVTSTILLIENVLLRMQIKIEKIWKITHFVFSLTLLIQVFINGLFWFGMYPFALINLWGNIFIQDVIMVICQHAIPLILLIVDLHTNYVIIWNYSYLLPHYIFLIFYLPINIYYTLNVKDVYPLITYKNIMTYLFLLICIIVVPICHFVTKKYCQLCKKEVINEIKQMSQKQNQLTQQNSFGQNYLSVIELDSTPKIIQQL